MERRRVLVLAYLFPPLGGAGVQRTLKFVRYLEPLGWDATVVSTKSRHYPARDPSLLEEIPASAQVMRTRALPLANWLSLVPYRLGLKRVSAYLNWPDGGIGWLPFALLDCSPNSTSGPPRRDLLDLHASKRPRRGSDRQQADRNSMGRRLP